MILITWDSLALHMSAFLLALFVFLLLKAIRALVHGNK